MASSARLSPVEDTARIAELEERVRRLEKINAALIDRVERASDMQGGAFSMFETAISLEALVRERTAELEEALARLEAANTDLALAHSGADAARARLRDAIESLSDGFALFDADDRLIMHNRAYSGFWPVLDTESSAQRPTFTEIATRIAESGQTVGSLISPERWLADRLALHRNAANAHVQALSDGRWVQINELRTSEGGTVGIYTDITEVKAEDARQRARELAEKSTVLQSTLDTIRLAVAVFDAGRRLIAWNGHLLSIVGLGEDGLSRLATHEGLVTACQEVNGPQGDGRPLDWLPDGAPETVALRRQASGRVVEVRRAPMPGGGMVMTFEDVTDRLQVAETLERKVAERTVELESEVAERRAVEAELLSAKTAAEVANRSKTSFLAAASHDLLQPLNAARLFVSALAERRLALPTRALVRQTAVALDSVEDLLEALFEISRLDAGAINPEITAIDLDRILAALRIEFAPLARAKGLALHLPDSGRWVSSDIRLLRRILQNFVSNAVRYTDSGEIELSVTGTAERVRIAVRDTGPGIAERDRTAIFEEFRRLDATQRTAGKGLGLSIVQRASAMLDHPITLHSVPGVGSEFAIDLPAAAAVSRTALRRGAGIETATAESGHILVIDNDPAILEGMRVLIENWGYAINVALDPSDPGVEPAIERGVDLVIADFHLDNGQLGDQAIAAIRARLGRQVPAMVITADRSDEIKARLAAAKLPALTKPIKPAQLRAMLRMLLAQPEADTPDPV
ncbi:signal transduction histidine kinase [Novosphingobium kunmingense]|uniref:histidine kinase n=1 Tax=Novosphingobium kunmingense TaxID=1211806 RepID=A0A2N0H6A7_9SPHN|nr:PAS-domain containing protein [Novosphingobium kunmingense]PKB14484.1 signal transduction histidine kinase [Novosphingobium kunmingense]